MTGGADFSQQQMQEEQQRHEEFISKVNKVQVELNAPKSQRNAFGKYNYRSAEDILAAVKPLLAETGLILNISDDVIYIGERVYIKAVASLRDAVFSIESTGLAREPLSKKGADESQITGAASSYARKYALNGLFAIDDTKDADATNTHGKKAGEVEESGDVSLEDALNMMAKVDNMGALQEWFKFAAATYPDARDAIIRAKDAAKERLS